MLAEPSQVMVLRPSITLSLEGKMHTRHSLKCPGLVGHANKKPNSRGWQLRTAVGPVFSCCWPRVCRLPPWPLPTEVSYLALACHDIGVFSTELMDIILHWGELKPWPPPSQVKDKVSWMQQWEICLLVGNIELTRIEVGWIEKQLQYCILELVRDSDRSAQGISFSELVGSPDVKMVEFLLGLVGTSDRNHAESITSFVKERMEGKLEGENNVSDTQLVTDKRITFYFEENISIGDSTFL